MKRTLDRGILASCGYMLLTGAVIVACVLGYRRFSHWLASEPIAGNRPVENGQPLSRNTVMLFRALGVEADKPGEIATERTGNTKAVENILNSGADVNGKSLSGYTPLMVAVLEGDIGSARALIRHHANPNLPGPSGETALCLCATYGDVRMMNLLVSAGADINMRGMAGLTPLMRSVIRHRLPCVQYLLSHGVDANAREDGGRTALWFARDFAPKSKAIEDSLLSAGAH